MTRDEWTNFQITLFTSFPGFGEYVRDKSPDPSATLDSWYETLRDVTFTEAMAVVNSWINGRRDPPRAYDRDYLAITIRQMALFNRTESNRFNAAKSIADERAAIRRHNATYKPAFVDLVRAFDIANVAARRMVAKEITREDYNRICEEALRDENAGPSDQGRSYTIFKKAE